MSLFKKLFGKPNANEQLNLTPENFLNSSYINRLVTKYKRNATILRPHKSEVQLGQNVSKFGGAPNFSAFECYPFCDKCETPLNFVLQLYREEFPNFYFPDDKNLFQLFRCPNHDCPEAYSEQYDHKMFHYYINVSNDNKKHFLKPSVKRANSEIEIPDCYLKPSIVDDFPNFDDFEKNDFIDIETKFGNKLADVFIESYSAIQNTKFGGYPSYTQSPCYPICNCGKTKEFFFQLSSEDPEDGVESPPPPDKWNPLGIMIGDVGNIYYYVCRSCGPKTIECNWDCY